MDPAVSDLLQSQLLSNAQISGQQLNKIGENLYQGLGIVQASVIQQQGSVTDDPGVLAALQAASASPKQGAMGGQ
jgi:hypothetical protein